MKSLLENLSKKTTELPKVDDEGNSECPFAEDLYAEKEEAIERVAEELNQLRRDREVVDQVVERHRRSLDVIRTDAGSLHSERAKEQYSFAGLSQEHSCREAIRCQNELSEIISWAENTLAMARSREFPGGKPQKKFRPPAGLANGLASSGTTEVQSQASGSPSKQSFENEINNLMDLGPLGQKDG